MKITRGVFLEYILSFARRNEQKQRIHVHAAYQIQNQICHFISQTDPLIRIIGDSILQQPAVLFPKEATLTEKEELAKQIDQAKSVLIHTGDAGIAANQCTAITKPYRFTIVGVFYKLAEHVQGVARRYPGIKETPGHGEIPILTVPPVHLSNPPMNSLKRYLTWLWKL